MIVMEKERLRYIERSDEERLTKQIYESSEGGLDRERSTLTKTF